MLTLPEKLSIRRRAAGDSEPIAASGTARTVALLVLAAILVVGQMYSVLALYRPMAASFGVAPHQTIWTSTAFGFAYAIGFLGSGPLTDRYGSRRMIIAGLMATAATTALVASAPNVAVAILLRVVQGLAASLFAPAAFAYIAVHVDARRRAIALSSVTSSMLAAAVIMQVGAQVLADLWTWQSVFLVCAPLLAAAAFLAAKLLKSGPQRPATPFRDAFRPIPKLIASARTALLYLATMTLLGSFVAVYTALALAGPESVTGSSATLLGVRASALPAMIVGPLVASRLAQISASRRVVGGLTAAAAALLLTSQLAGTVVGIALSLDAFVIAVVITAPALVEVVGAQAGPARGTAVALYAFSMFAGGSIGSQLVGTVADLGFGTLVIGAATALAAGALLAAFASTLGRSHQLSASSRATAVPEPPGSTVVRRSVHGAVRRNDGPEIGREGGRDGFEGCLETKTTSISLDL